MALKKLVAGNWKMHGLSSDLDEIRAIADGVARNIRPSTSRLCLPAILIERAVARRPRLSRSAAQDVHHAENGAHTGCISALHAARCRREPDDRRPFASGARRSAKATPKSRPRPRRRLRAASTSSCASARASRSAKPGRRSRPSSPSSTASLPGQVDEAAELAIAYEPIWAIGTGKVPTVDEIGEMHAALRGRWSQRFGDAGEQMRILYGGSVKASNAAEIFASPMSTARWSAAQASRPPISSRSSPPRQLPSLEGRAPVAKSPPTHFPESPPCSPSC